MACLKNAALKRAVHKNIIRNTQSKINWFSEVTHSGTKCILMVSIKKVQHKFCSSASSTELAYRKLGQC